MQTRDPFERLLDLTHKYAGGIAVPESDWVRAFEDALDAGGAVSIRGPSREGHFTHMMVVPGALRGGFPHFQNHNIIAWRGPARI